MAKNYKVASERQVPEGVVKTLFPIVAAIAFFVLTSLSGGDPSKMVGMICGVLAAIAVVVRVKVLKERFTLPMLAAAFFVLMGGISTFYALAGKFALSEFLKVLIAFCMALMLLAAAPGTGVAPGRQIATVLERSAALAGLVSIDLMSTRIISSAVLGILGTVTTQYTKLVGHAANSRMWSMFDNPNVYAGVAGIGVMLSLGLTLSSESKKERVSHLVCLSILALSFVLAFSMGGTAMVVLGFLAYLILERREQKAALLVLMVETFLVTIACTAVIAVLAFDAWTGIQPIPLLVTVIGCALLCVLDSYVGQKLSDKLAPHGKAVFAIIAAAVVLMLAFVFLAYNLTGSQTLAAGESVRRSVYLEPGEYTLSAQTDGSATVVIRSQNRYDTMMYTSTEVYRGPVSGAWFTVPEDSVVVYLTFSSGEGATLHSVVCEGPETASVPLEYKLLPDFIANRLQGLWANQNFTQRTVFFGDGMKMFRRSPIIGLGMGSFENAVKGVQSFHYETKYAHNHYIQTLAETGAIGLALFILLLGSSAAAVLFNLRKKEETHPLTPALGAALVFMAGHGGVEVNFSSHHFLPIAFGVFALISLCCGASLPTPWYRGKVKAVSVIAVAALVLVFLGFLGGNMKARKLVQEQTFMASFEKAAQMDKFEWADYLLSYVVSASRFPEEAEVQRRAEIYAQRLATLDSNTVPIYLAEFYFNKGDMEQGLAMIEKHVHYVSSDSAAWNKALAVLANYDDGSEEYRQGAMRIIDFLDEWQANNIGTIKLDQLGRVVVMKYKEF